MEARKGIKKQKDHKRSLFGYLLKQVDGKAKQRDASASATHTHHSRKDGQT